jgi:hypothetical protein
MSEGKPDMIEEKQEIPWGPLGEVWWREAGAQVRATEQQIKLAACLEAGTTKTEAAIRSGYADDKERARKAGSEASMSTAVSRLRALARAEANADKSPEVAKDVSHSELRRVYSEMIRGPDPALRLRAGEALQKLLEPETSHDWIPGRAMDGFDGARIVRDFLRHPGGAAAAAILHCHCMGVELAAMDLLHDVHTAMQRETPEVWDILVKRQSAVSRAILDQRLNDESWQREARQKLWLEVGIDIDINNPPQGQSSFEVKQTAAG